MAGKKARSELSVGDMLREVGEGIKRQARDPNILAYRPSTKQILFHKSEAPVRLYIGGNRSGKTVGGVTESIFHLRGQHPYKKVPAAPIRGRAIGQDYLHGIGEILIPKFRQWIPPSLLIKGSWSKSYNATEKKLTLANGSTLVFLTYEQELQSHAGTSLHFVHFDEEPPLHIYNENMMRLIDTNGVAWLTMTPLDGMTWVYDGLYTKGLSGADKNIEVINASIHDNPHLSKDAIQRIMGNVDDPAERKSREFGEFQQIGGRVYKNFSKETHVIPPIDPKELMDWEWYRSVDHGFNNPTAWLWHAVHPNGSIITFAEHYESGLTVEEHSVKVKEIDKALGRTPEVSFGDPAMAQHQAVTGTSIFVEYALRDIYITPGNNDVVTGVNKVTSYLGINPVTKKPYWQITENCSNLVWEMERLRWETPASKKAMFDNNAREKIHKKDDHASDSARYFFSSRPDLRPTLPEEKVVIPGHGITERYDQALVRHHVGAQQPTEWEFEENPTVFVTELDDGL